MRRREFIAGIAGSATAWPLAARAQQGSNPEIGFLRSSTAQGSAHLVAAFRQGLESGGFSDGHNVAIVYRYADNNRRRLSSLAQELVRRQVAVIVVNGGAAGESKAATHTIPIVFVTGVDPVKFGLVASFNRPGGNITGIVFTVAAIASKRLGLLHELLPNAKMIVVLLDPNSPGFERERRGLEEARGAIHQRIFVVTASNEQELDQAFASLTQAGAAALHVGGGGFFRDQRQRLAALAARHSLPAVYVGRDFCQAGGLMSYGPSQSHAYRKAGVYVARILRGTKPADLPVEQATEFDLVINLKTAKALGLKIPPMLLARADEVIE
jgi:ABC-type uncharacterized transport system substrate-binding protein